MEDRARSRSPAPVGPADAEARLLDQIRSGDAEAGHQLVREHYAAIYHYLLHLTTQPDQAEDLTQETFLQAWRRLETFQARGSLRGWLLRIARREFLDLLQRRRAVRGWEGLDEVAALEATPWTDSVELREVINGLPLEQREAVLLHDLEGYTSSEIAAIVGAPASTVRRRLALARESLRQALGEGDLAYLNEPSVSMQQWGWLPLEWRGEAQPDESEPSEHDGDRREVRGTEWGGGRPCAGASAASKDAAGSSPLGDSRQNRRFRSALAFLG